MRLFNSPDQEPSEAGVRLGRPRDWLIGTALLLALLLAVHFTVGWGPLLAPWRELSLGLLVVLFVLSALSYALRAVRVHDYFRPRFNGCFPTVLRLSILHNAANNLLPMRTGEVVFPLLMRRYFGHGLLDASAALLWIRLLDLHCLALIGIFILNLRDPSGWWWILAIAWTGAVMLLVPLGRFAARMKTSGRLDRRAGTTRVLVRVIMAAPREIWTLARVYLWTLLTWALKFAAFAILLGHFLPIDFWRVMTGVMGAELSSVLPFHGIAGSGSYEIAIVAALTPLGVDPQQALAGAVNLHLFLLGTTLILAALAFALPRRSPCHAAPPAP
ncbi:hypothetical protein CKO25_07030 [Thiocapsa imhoffii]|uniref:Flippase-like domain-containing protein n=1 Tax=Thiocapsa imhoffii TaxID=382777 RepID=A0A9X0WH24_9GAMM|nr:lysylphosphatidylglycerol synthase transmembrane domain-containing protein [Thiocapsa imhoffii]MBK1644413.1 hypothetical protein [Thiocapsa imhoffii]